MKHLKRVARLQGIVMGLVMIGQAFLNVDAYKHGLGTATFIQNNFGGLDFFNGVLVTAGILSIAANLRKQISGGWQLFFLSLPVFAYIAAYLWYSSGPDVAKASTALYLGYYADKIILMLSSTGINEDERNR